nr:restriction endonuclease subunit S [Acinetobacter sp. ANC 5378]
MDSKEKYQTQNDKIWLLNLDQIEQHTGKILSKEYINTSEIGISTHYFRKGTVLYSKLRPYLNKVVVADEDGFATTELVPINCDLNKINPEYLAYFLRSDIFLNFATNVVAGAKMPRMVMSEFWNYDIPLPPLSEQRRIASILDKADKLRQKRQQAIEKLDQLLQATFINMFGDPVSNPKGWECCKLGKIVIIKGGGTPSRNIDEYWNGQIPWVTVKDFKENLLINGALESITIEGVNNSATNIIPKGTLIMPTRMGLGKVALTGLNVAINQDIKALFIKDEQKISQNFLLYFLLQMKNQIISLGKGATVKGITLEDLNSFNTINPPLDLQEKWSKIALAIDDQKQKLYKQLEIQENLFKSLQNQAFSGKL